MAYFHSMREQYSHELLIRFQSRIQERVQQTREKRRQEVRMLFFQFAMKIAHAYLRKRRKAQSILPRYMQSTKTSNVARMAQPRKKAINPTANFSASLALPTKSLSPKERKPSVFANSSNRLPAIEVQKAEEPNDGQEPPLGPRNTSKTGRKKYLIKKVGIPLFTLGRFRTHLGKRLCSTGKVLRACQFTRKRQHE